MHESGEILNRRYQITEILGKGGVGITYSAVDTQTESTVAIKAVSLKKLRDWKQIELFEREASVLATLNHPYIPQYLGYFNIESDRDKVFYIVQQLAPGKSLFQLVSNGWRVTESEVKYITEQILSILDYLHSLKPPVIHRDIKPQNLICSNEGEIFLVDFGAVQNTYYDTLMQGSTVVGTYGYMAPEQFRGKAVPATDLYSLGATILYLLTHRSPSELPQNTLKIDFKSHVNISESFIDWLDRILEIDPQDRFSSAKKALSVLNKKPLPEKQPNKQREVSSESCFFVIVMTLIIAISIIFCCDINTKVWAILSRIGYYPIDICNNSNSMSRYLKHGGILDLEVVYLDKIINNIQGDKIKSHLLECSTGIINREIVSLIQNRVIDIESYPLYHESLLFYSVFNQDIITLKNLLSQDINLNIETNYNGSYKTFSKSKHSDEFYIRRGYTPLLIASMIGDIEVVQLLIDNGADVNATTIHNYSSTRIDRETRKRHTLHFSYIYTPLSQAVVMGNLEVVKILLEHGADMKMKVHHNQSIFDLGKSDRKIMELLQSYANPKKGNYK